MLRTSTAGYDANSDVFKRHFVLLQPDLTLVVANAGDCVDLATVVP